MQDKKINKDYWMGDDGVLHRKTSVHQGESRNQTAAEHQTISSNTDESNCLGAIAAFILPFVTFFALGGFAEKIYFFIKPLNDNSTIEDLYNGKITALAFLSIAYLIITECFIREDDSNSVGIIPYAPLLTGIVLQFGNLILSLDFSVILVLSSIADIGFMIYSGYKAATE